MFQSIIGVFPAAIKTIIVSPTALPRPIMTAEKIPPVAAGMITRTVVCQGVAPVLSEPLRR
jgi:DNA-binding transcriptional regulator YdaS (Cro superfamily)